MLGRSWRPTTVTAREAGHGGASKGATADGGEGNRGMASAGHGGETSGGELRQAAGEGVVGVVGGGTSSGSGRGRRRGLTLRKGVGYYTATLLSVAHRCHHCKLGLWPQFKGTTKGVAVDKGSWCPTFY